MLGRRATPDRQGVTFGDNCLTVANGIVGDNYAKVIDTIAETVIVGDTIVEMVGTLGDTIFETVPMFAETIIGVMFVPSGSRSGWSPPSATPSSTRSRWSPRWSSAQWSSSGSRSGW
ncbi:MAG: hypothetical protein AMXMBFR64_39520 [Myxococcales bacterium]